MNLANQQQPLHKIDTDWADVFGARPGEGESHAARCRLAMRYIGAVRRYIARVLRNQDAANELAQEFVVRVLQGDFHRADPSHGRFRDFVRAAARNLVHDHRRRCKARPPTLADKAPEPVAPLVETDALDAEFIQSWRRELLERALISLADYQQRTGRPYHEIISLRARDPQLSSAQMAALCSARLGEPVSDVWVRQTLRRARACLSDLLLKEVSATLEGPSYEELEQELIILDLLDYCDLSPQRRGHRGAIAESGGQTPAALAH
jgi:RNA polymerase sigma factor (sigma-70 family)